MRLAVAACVVRTVRPRLPQSVMGSSRQQRSSLQRQLAVLAWLLLLCAACSRASGLAARESSRSRLAESADDAVARAVRLRDAPDASARDHKHATTLLRTAAGLVSSGSGPDALLPVPGFPELSFARNGSAAALRELAKSYQRGVGVEVSHRLSLELFRRAAELGDPQAHGAMGMRMAWGLHHPYSFEGASIRLFGPPDEAGALLHYYFGAAGGDAFSQAALGYRHAYGIGVPRSCWSAVAYYKPVAEAVVAEAVEGAKAAGPLGSSSGRGLPQLERIRLNVHANQAAKHDRHREVMQYYQYSADRGNTDAQTAVGTLLNIGSHGVSRDHAAAAHYLQKAAAAGNGEAMAHLGHMYGAGLGVPKDASRALAWFRKAAAKQAPLGLYGLGYMHLAGAGGVEQDYDAAYKYLSAAADGGDRDAQFYLGAMYLNGLGMRRKSLNKAVMHFFQAANLGHVQAAFNVAMMHLAGRGTPRSCKPALGHLKGLVEKGPLAAPLQAGHEAFFRGHHNQALLSYLAAAEVGLEVAQGNAAWMLQRGFSHHAGPRAASVAATLYRRSAEQGNTLSLLQLGDAYYYGSGVDQDLVRSAAIYYEAYKGGSSEAMYNVGYMHEYGAGVPRDFALALRFYNMAAHSNADAALPVHLARAWLRLHAAWEWARPALPRGLVRALGWLFELPPSPPVLHGAGLSSDGDAAAAQQAALAQASLAAAAGGAGAGAGAAGSKSSSSSSEGEWGRGQAAAGLPPRAGGGGDSGAQASSAQQQQQQQQPGARHASHARQPGWLAWLLPQPGLMVWQWDSLVWRLAEAAGMAGLSISSVMQEYADLGETLLLLVLLAVLGLVLHIRRQRQTALQARVLAELAAQPGGQQALRAQQLAAELGLPITPTGQGLAAAPPAAPAPGADAAAAGAGSGAPPPAAAAAAPGAAAASGECDVGRGGSSSPQAPESGAGAGSSSKQQTDAALRQPAECGAAVEATAGRDTLLRTTSSSTSDSSSGGGRSGGADGSSGSKAGSPECEEDAT